MATSEANQNRLANSCGTAALAYDTEHSAAMSLLLRSPFACGTRLVIARGDAGLENWRGKSGRSRLLRPSHATARRAIMRRLCRLGVAASAALTLWLGGQGALAQKSGGILKMPDFASPASMSIRGGDARRGHRADAGVQQPRAVRSA